MRTLHADLLAAQKQPSRRPAVSVVFTNTIHLSARHDFTTLNTDSNAGAKHDAAVTDNHDLHRVRISGGEVFYQRWTPGGLPPAGWTSLATGKGSNVAAAAAGSRVLVAYTAADGVTILVRESTDGGQTFAAEATAHTTAATISDLAADYVSGAGDCAVAWTTSGAVTLGLRRRVSGSWITATAHPSAFATTLTGVAMTYVDQFNIAVTGNENPSTRPTVWSTYYETVGGTWGTPQPQVQGDSGVTSFGSPFTAYDGSMRVTFAEVQLFTGGYTRVFRSSVHPLVDWSGGAFNWRTPAPTSYAVSSGLAIASSPTLIGGSFWESGLQLLRIAGLDPVQHDASGDVLALEIREDHDSYAGHVDLDNSQGHYNPLPAALAVGNRCTVALGYYTASGNRTSPLPDLAVAGWEFRRDGGMSSLRVLLESGWDALARNTQRTAIAETTATYLQIIERIVARAGLRLIATSPSSRTQTISPAFTIDPSMSGRAALQHALAFLADRAQMAENSTIRLNEPLAGDSADYTFGGDHPLGRLELRTVPDTANEAHALGAGVFGDDVDFAAAQHRTAIARIRDVTSTSAAAADATAAAHRRQLQLRRPEGRIIAQPNVGLELMDVVQLADDLVPDSDTPRRVTAITWRYDVRRPIFEQEVRLGPR